MSRVNAILDQAEVLEPAEKQELIRRLLGEDLSHHTDSATPPGIESTPGVCGGEARVAGTRIPVWTLEAMRRQAISEAEILRSYPTLKASDLVNAWAYRDRFSQEITDQIAANEDA